MSMASRPSSSSAAAFGALEGEQFILLTTFRRSGAGVGTPVWFAREGDTLYITTQERTGKVKRIRHTPQVTLTPSNRLGTVKGPSVGGQARIVASAEESVRAEAALRRKYGATYRMIRLIGRLRRRGVAQRVFLAVTPAVAPSDLA